MVVTMRPEEHDVVVIGGGPAGVSAALECHNNQLDTVLLEATPALGGQLAEIPFDVRNVATGWYADGKALQAGLQRSAEFLRERVLLRHPVSSAALSAGRVDAGSQQFHGRAVLIASGTRREELPAAPDGAFSGDVTYQLETRPDGFRGQPVIVIGGGDSATLDALELASTASSVMLVHRSGALTARHDIAERVHGDGRIIDLPGWEVESLSGGEHLERAVLVHAATKEQRTVAAGGLVVKISRVPCTVPFQGQIDLDRKGFVVTDSERRTSRGGVFAAGDVVAGAYWRVAYALGEGMRAARSILEYVEAR
jgi:thioredoxin reductase (NADPH)